MKKILISISAIFISLTLFTSTAFSWGPATHVYFANMLGDESGYYHLQEKYCGNAPDSPWMLFGGPTGNQIGDALGGLTHNEWEQVERAAWWPSQIACASGGSIHNRVDHTAHVDSASDPTENDGGYVNNRARALARMLGGPFWRGLGLEPSDSDDQETILTICHLAIEFLVDLGAAGKISGIPALEPGIGLNMFLSAWLRSPTIPWLLVRALADDLARITPLNYWQATEAILTAEQGAQEVLEQYGLGLIQTSAGESIVSSPLISTLIGTVNTALGTSITLRHANTIITAATGLVTLPFVTAQFPDGTTRSIPNYVYELLLTAEVPLVLIPSP